MYITYIYIYYICILYIYIYNMKKKIKIMKNILGKLRTTDYIRYR